MKRHPGLLDTENRLATPGELGDNLEKLDYAVEWEGFRPLAAALRCGWDSTQFPDCG